MLVARYRERLHGHAIAPPPEIDPGHVYHLFPIRATKREQLREHLSNSGIDTVVPYPTPLPEHPAYKSKTAVICPIAEYICREIVSLPPHPALTDDSIDRIIETVNGFTS